MTLVHKAAILAIHLALASQPVQAQPVELGVHFSSGDRATMPIVLASGKVHVRAMLAGHGPVWLLLDTGANVSILDKSLADEIGLELRGGGSGDDAAGGQSFTFAFATSPAMSFPGVEIDARPIAVIDRKTQGVNGHASRGLLGADFFRAFVVDIDYPNQTMTLHRPETFSFLPGDEPGASVELPIVFDANDKWRTKATLSLGNRALVAELIVDTGSRGTIGFSAPFVVKHQLLADSASRRLVTVGYGIGGPVQHGVGHVDRLEMGPLSFDSLPVTYAPKGAGGAYGRADRDGILGAEILRRFRAIFDRARLRLILQPSDTPVEPIRADASGLFLTSEGPAFDQIRILAVAEGSAAARAGLLARDRIRAIDGTPAESLDQVRALFLSPKTTYRLSVERSYGSTTQEIEVDMLTGDGLAASLGSDDPIER